MMTKHTVAIEDFTQEELTLVKTLASSYSKGSSKKLEIITSFIGKTYYRIYVNGVLEYSTHYLKSAIDSYNSFN